MMCLWLPNWPVQRQLNEKPELGKRALLLYAVSRGKPIVTACAPAAAKAGVVPGMPLAEARTLWPAGDSSLWIIPHDARGDRRALLRWAHFAQRYSPRVCLEDASEPECLLLDITGCSHLFGSEKALADQALHDLRRRGIKARAAIADTVGSAWAFAHAAHYSPRPGGEGLGVRGIATIVPAGKHRTLLAELDLAWLRLSPDIVRRFQEFDIRTVGHLLRIPRAEIVTRFGREVLWRLDQALGDVPEIVRPERFVEPVAASWTFEDATAQRWVLEKAIEHLLQKMLDRLAPQQLGIERLRCELRTTNKEQVSLSVGLLHPSDSVRYLMELARLHLRAVAGPRSWRQGRMFETERRDTRDVFRGLLERLSNRVGEKGVLRAYLRPEAQPEFSWGYVPWLGGRPPADGGTLPAALTRPADLRDSPAPVRVEAAGRPTRLVWRERSYAVTRSWGPERIETGWWRGRDIRRDYYRVELEGGERLWLFRDLARGRWFLHGAFV
jgi:protein ImuB